MDGQRWQVVAAIHPKAIYRNHQRNVISFVLMTRESPIDGQVDYSAAFCGRTEGRTTTTIKK